MSEGLRVRKGIYELVLLCTFKIFFFQISNEVLQKNGNLIWDIN
jgi:hypothetical protein